MTLMLVKSWLLAVIMVVITACSTVSAPTNPNASRYRIQKDRAPIGILDIATIPEVTPVQVTRSMAGNLSPYTVLGKTYHVMPTEEGYSDRGVASW